MDSTMKKVFILLLLSIGFIGTVSADIVETNILKLKALNNCKSCNLIGADLSETNLSGADLWNADLSGANLWNADLSGANFSETNLSGANLWNADLSEATLCNTETSWGIDDSDC